MDHNANDDSSGSDSSSTSSVSTSTTSEDVTTGDSNYSPSESDAESSTSSESRVPLSSLVKNRLVEYKGDATEINENKKSKKRKAYKSTWKKNLAKRLKDQGKAYLSSTTNKPMKEKTMGPPCQNIILYCWHQTEIPVSCPLKKTSR